MKVLTVLTLLSFLAIGCSSRPTKFDKEHMEIQRQEAHNMINQSNDIEIKKGLGNDKIILKDE